MTGVDAKSDLLIYLQGAREALLWKLDGLGEYDIRRPLREDGEVTLHRVVVHMTAETQRHAGHADIVRELIDGTAGLLKGSDNLPSTDQEWWRDYSNQVDLAARSVPGH